jgi:hypothetical protein
MTPFEIVVGSILLLFFADLVHSTYAMVKLWRNRGEYREADIARREMEIRERLPKRTD